MREEFEEKFTSISINGDFTKLIKEFVNHRNSITTRIKG